MSGDVALHIGFAVESGSGGEDRASVLEAAPGRRVLLVADGAGGSGGGAAAADALVATVRARAAALHDADACVRLLEDFDHTRACAGEPGETAAVLCVAGAGALCGASAGDAGARCFGPGGDLELTEGQDRARLGSGVAVARPFGPVPLAGALVLASDGLWKYAQPAWITSALREDDPSACARALVDCVRLPSGRFQDDVSVIVCRSPGAFPARADRTSAAAAPLATAEWLEVRWPPRAPDPRLVAHDTESIAPAPGRLWIRLPPAGLVIGRGGPPGSGAVLQAALATLGRRQCRIQPAPSGAGWELHDLGSTGGTFVGDRRVVPGRPALLAAGDVVHLGAPRQQVRAVLRLRGPGTPPAGTRGA